MLANTDASTSIFAVVAVASGDGLVNIFKEMGVDYVVSGGQSMNPSTEDFINGFDTLKLAKLSKQVFAFDIQEDAINNTKELLDKNVVDNVTLIHDSHHNIDKHLYEYNEKISLVLFNLGYLPGNNKDIMTNSKTTLLALEKSYKLLNKKGIILMVCYPHIEGKKESNTIIKYLEKNKWTITF